ncbi:MAG: hypothetical protein O0X93_08395 [Methanocorpusculum sp.]|nr:hypothetical protein [Methanocorpusculum sp.]MDE2523157.1 hypothetical protein [Methanocorpusculum sp.]MDE2525021.1 hypothetical protein [Methanocorpusculum sp.]
MMGTKRTLDETLTKDNKKVEMPLHNVIDKISLMYKVNVTDTATESIKYADIMGMIKSIRLVSDGNKVHYDLSALDLAIMNLYDHGQTGMIHPDDTISLTANTAADVVFMVQMERGDLLANTKQSLDLTHDFDTTNGTVTINSISAAITISEKIYETRAEFDSVYAYMPDKRGENLDLAAEPKISVVTKKFDPSTENRDVYDIPVGCLSRRIIFISQSSKGVRAGAEPIKLGININDGRKTEMYNNLWKQQQMMNEADYHTKKVAGVVVLDMGAEIMGDDYGIRAWEFKKGDYTVVTRADTAGQLRMIHEEYVVNTSVFDAVENAIIEA